MSQGWPVFGHLNLVEYGLSNVLFPGGEASIIEHVRLFLALPLSSDNFWEICTVLQLIFSNRRVNGKKSEMKGWKDEVRDLWGIFLGNAKTQDVALHPMVLKRQTEGIWPESGGGREKGLHWGLGQAFWSAGGIATERRRGRTVPSSEPSFNSLKLEEAASPSEVLFHHL